MEEAKKSQSAVPEPPASQETPFPLRDGAAPQTAPGEASASMPPAMASVKQHTADEILTLLNRTPLFMTTLDEGDGEGGENVELEALRALAHEGTRAEVAANFREQGNEQARARRWGDAKQFYDRALAALRGPQTHSDVPVVDLDEHAEAAKEREIEEACHVNRALCNLEKQNFRSCMFDCASALRLNPQNVKAWYRSSSACLALDKIPEAEDACARGQEVDASNAALKALAAKIVKRKEHLEAVERKRKEREERLAAEKRALKTALKARNIPTRKTERPPELEDAAVKLADPVDPSSTLSFPVMFLYPIHLQSDFIKAFQEGESVGEHLSYIFPLPWDEGQVYTTGGVDCYIETTSGGLIKAGKKLSLLKILTSGKVEIVDDLLRIYVIPQKDVPKWIEDFKAKQNK